MKMKAWCREHGLTKANCYYRLRRVRKACLELCETSPSFVELTAPADNIQEKEDQIHFPVAAVLHAGKITINLCNDASPEFFRNLMGAIGHA